MKLNLVNLSLDRKVDIALRAMNFFQSATKQLTDLEILLINIIVHLPDKFKYAPFSIPAKKYIRKLALEQWEWNLSPINLNNRLYSLRDKGIINHDVDGVMYFTPVYEKIIKEIKEAHDEGRAWELAFSFPIIPKSEETIERVHPRTQEQIERQRDEEDKEDSTRPKETKE